MTEKTKAIIDQINTDNEDLVGRAIDMAAKLTDLKEEEKLEITQALSSLFYHDYTGKLTFAHLVGKAEKQIAKFGMGVVPFLIGEIMSSDAESASRFGRAIAANGAPALTTVLEAINAKRNEDFSLINLLTALSTFRVPEAAKALPEILVAAKSANAHVRAEAIHAFGRLAKNVDNDAFDDKLRLKMFDVAMEALKDQTPLVRHHATRALGKMLQKGMLTGEQEDKLGKKFSALLGLDGQHNWDNAFIVRHEAEKYTGYFRDAGSTKNKYYQSFRILEKKYLCPDTYYYTIQAQLIAKKLQAGQFVITRPHEYSERIPLSICGWDREKGTINLIVSAAGKTTREITNMPVGSCLADVVGPLGEQSHAKKHEGTCVVIGGGYGTGAVLPTARKLKELGNRVVGIVGARNEKLLLMVDELKSVCDEVLLTTNDGTAGIKGFVIHALEAILKRGEKVSHVLAIGPVPMMMAVANMTKPLGIETYVSLNAIMVDGTGMCGACRVSVGGQTRFACFHGPDFDGHKVDFDQLMKRQKMFVAQEKEALAAADF